MNGLLGQVEVDGRRVDVRVRDGHISELADALHPAAGEEVIDGAGGALLPGLHDHHVHLLATAAAMSSVSCGPPSVDDLGLLTAAMRSAPGTGWVRGVGYAETVAGPMDRHLLDSLVADRPVRVQHRSGGLWMLNSLALRLTGLDRSTDRDVERDANGEATGRLWRFDTRLRALLDEDATDISVLCRTLHRYGVIGVTDATPDLDNGAITLLAKAPLDLVLLGAPDDAGLPDGMRAGPRKLLLRDHDLPDLDELAASIRHEHDGGRPVAVHCVTRESLVLTVLALERVGTVDGDRIEHAAVVVPDMVPRLADLRVAVVTQPSFIWLRGDDYVRDVAADDVNCLYPYASLLAAGMSVAPSSDAPYGDLDPWRTIVAARARSTSGDAVVAPEERVSAVTALRGFLSPLLDPGGPPRQVTCGAAADLCLLDAPLSEALAEPDAGHVRLVLHQGEVVFAA